MENIKPSVYFPYREADARLEKDSTAVSKALLHTCCNAKPICCLLWRKKLFFGFIHTMSTPVSQHKRNLLCVFVPRAGRGWGNLLSPGVVVTYQPPHGLLRALHCSARWAAPWPPAAAAPGAAASAPPPPSPSWPWPGSHGCCWNGVSPSEWCYLKQQENLLKSPLKNCFINPQC